MTLFTLQILITSLFVSSFVLDFVQYSIRVPFFYHVGIPLFSERFSSDVSIEKQLYQFLKSGSISPDVLINQIGKDRYGLLSSPHHLVFTGEIVLVGKNEIVTKARLTLTAILAPITLLVWISTYPILILPLPFMLLYFFLLKEKLREVAQVYFDASKSLGHREDPFSII